MVGLFHCCLIVAGAQNPRAHESRPAQLERPLDQIPDRLQHGVQD